MKSVNLGKPAWSLFILFATGTAGTSPKRESLCSPPRVSAIGKPPVDGYLTPIVLTNLAVLIFLQGCTTAKRTVVPQGLIHKFFGVFRQFHHASW